MNKNDNLVDSNEYIIKEIDKSRELKNKTTKTTKNNNIS